MVVENVKGAQPWVGSARWHYGSYYLWGDVPALMPITLRTVKQEGRNFHFPEKYGIPSPSFHGATHETSVRDALALKTVGHANKRDGFDHTRHLTNQRESDALKVPGIKLSEVGFNVAAAQRYREDEALKNGGNGTWFHGGSCEGGTNPARSVGRSDSRKAASAMIAEIPFDLASHIAHVFRP